MRAAREFSSRISSSLKVCNQPCSLPFNLFYGHWFLPVEIRIECIIFRFVCMLLEKRRGKEKEPVGLGFALFIWYCVMLTARGRECEKIVRTQSGFLYIFLHR